MASAEPPNSLRTAASSAAKAAAGAGGVARRTFANFVATDAATVQEQLDAWTNHNGVKDFIKEQADLMKPDRIHLCDGTKEEYDMLCRELVACGVFTRLNDDLRPNSFLARSDPGDVARREKATVICCQNEEDAGKNNIWRDPIKMRQELTELYEGSMAGRTMYVVPHAMGPLGSDFTKVGIEVTDSAYVATNMRIMTRMGDGALRMIDGEKEGEFVRGVHSSGAPLKPLEADGAPDQDTTWPSSETKWITHFPETREIKSFGSGYGGNALLGKKCFALRIASAIARDEGWLAEHMLILKLTSPEGKVKYICAAFPSASGKTNLAMIESAMPGWKAECLGDDIAWLRKGEDGRLYAVNPENGFFGVAPGTGMKTNPNAMRALHSNCIYTNVALNPETGDVWWEGMTEDEPERLVSWLRRPWYKGDKAKFAAHPNSRFTAPAEQCPIIADNWEDPAGVPIDAILFGGRRASTIPLVYQTRDWAHGTYAGATMTVEQTAAAEGSGIRNDPMAMKPFCGYHFGDYWQHWLNVGEGSENMPKVFYVNWFKRSAEGKFLWPGFGDNMRVLEWIFNRCDGDGSAAPSVETPLGAMPDWKNGGLNLEGLEGKLSDADMEELFRLDGDEWRAEVERWGQELEGYDDRLPEGIRAMHAEQLRRVAEM